jgi:hypothetical protein
VSVNDTSRDAAFLAPDLGQKLRTGESPSRLASKRPDERKLRWTQSDATGANADGVVVPIKTEISKDGIVDCCGTSWVSWNQRKLWQNAAATPTHGASEGLVVDGRCAARNLPWDLHKFLT